MSREESTMGLGLIFKCTPLRFVKFGFVCLVLFFFVVYFPREETKVRPKASRFDYIDPDTLQRNPFIPKSGKTDNDISMHPTKYTKSSTIRFGHKCVQLTVAKEKSAICVYDRDIDNLISSYVTDFRTWEAEQLEIMGNVLKRNKNMQVVDLGCNIGVYTIFAAKMGRQVIAVDPVLTNLQLLDKSLTLGHLRDKVTLIHNAISNQPHVVSIDLRRGNIGGTRVNIVSQAKKMSGNLKSKIQGKPLKRVKRYKRLPRLPLQQKKAHKIVKKALRVSTKKPTTPSKLVYKPKNHRKISTNHILPGKRMGPNILQIKQVAKSGVYKPSKKMANKIIMKPPVGIKVYSPKNTLKQRKQGSAWKQTISSKPLNVKQSKKLPNKPKQKHNEDVLKQDKSNVQAVTLDDLVSLGTFKQTFLKIDIAGWENLAFDRSTLFLREFNVMYILMEWSQQRRGDSGGQLVGYLMKNGFMPYKTDKDDKFLDFHGWRSWPDKIFWKKR